jgi:hypothetical protein
MKEMLKRFENLMKDKRVSDEYMKEMLKKIDISDKPIKEMLKKIDNLKIDNKRVSDESIKREMQHNKNAKEDRDHFKNEIDKLQKSITCLKNSNRNEIYKSHELLLENTSLISRNTDLEKINMSLHLRERIKSFLISLQNVSGGCFTYTDTTTYKNLETFFKVIQKMYIIDLIQLLIKLYTLYSKLCSIAHLGKEYPLTVNIIDKITNNETFISQLGLNGFNNDEIKPIDYIISFKRIDIFKKY